MHFISALIAVFVYHGIDVAFLLAADKQGAVLPERHTPRIRNIVRIERDGKTRRKCDRIERKGAGVDAGMRYDKRAMKRDQRRQA